MGRVFPGNSLYTTASGLKYAWTFPMALKEMRLEPQSRRWPELLFDPTWPRRLFLIKMSLEVINVHYCDAIMSAMASQITSLTIVNPSLCWDTDQRDHQSSASLAFVQGIHRRPVNAPHKWPVTRKMFPFDDVIMLWSSHKQIYIVCLLTTIVLCTGTGRYRVDVYRQWWSCWCSIYVRDLLVLRCP